jgi:hypothetical protein
VFHECDSSSHDEVGFNPPVLLPLGKKFSLVKSYGSKVLLYNVNAADIAFVPSRKECYLDSDLFRCPSAWPPTLSVCESQLAAHQSINLTGLPNYLGARLPVHSTLRMDRWRELLSTYADSSICDLLEFGFPIGYSVDVFPRPADRNHKGALSFASHVDNYILTEVALGATLGPFTANPLFLPLAFSPLNTVDKPGSRERRIIMDLSFPHGHSVNSGITKGEYLGELWQLTYPTVDSFAALVRDKGVGCLMFKRDLKRAYRQFAVDPGDIHLLAFFWRGHVFIDHSLPFGLRSAAFLCQRVTCAIAFLMRLRGASLCNYLDDFGGVDLASHAAAAYRGLAELLTDLGVLESPSKAAPPSTVMTFIGIQFDSVKMSMEVTPERLLEISEILRSWARKRVATKRELQSLIGKLQYAAKCVRASRIFISRLLVQLAKLNGQSHKFTISREFRKDLNWWSRFMESFNGVTLIGDMAWTTPDGEFATDACLTGCGGANRGTFFRAMFPDYILAKELHISALELLTVLLAVRLWCAQYHGMRIIILCDNLASVQVLNSGRTKDPWMLLCVREIAFLCAQHNLELRAQHIAGVLNRIPDLLSRDHLDPANFLAFQELNLDLALKEIVVSELDFTFVCNW